MVNLTNMLLKSHGSGKGHQNWIESLRVYCKAGRGGNGLPTVGGVGGRGGDVIIECAVKSNKKNEDPFKSLNDVFKTVFNGDSKKQRLLAGVGANARLQRIIGEAGAHTVLKVPPGVEITDDSSGRILKDFNRPGEKVVAAIGGQGGGPNNDWIGVKGQQRFIRLDLKLLADVGLVGFPNAGKSTLLKAISKANPKIASYPFTTIKPNLGHLLYEDGREITMADLPGLIEGASYNVGMGHRFLKHVERTRLLLFVVDISGFQLNSNSTFRNAFETVTLLNREIELYNPDLLGKPAICLVNKMDTDNDEKSFKDFLRRLNDNTNEEYLQNLSDDCRPNRTIEFKDVIPISAKFNHKSVDYVKEKLRIVIDEVEEAKLNLNANVKKFEVAFEDATFEKNPRIY